MNRVNLYFDKKLIAAFALDGDRAKLVEGELVAEEVRISEARAKRTGIKPGRYTPEQGAEFLRALLAVHGKGSRFWAEEAKSETTKEASMAAPDLTMKIKVEIDDSAVQKKTGIQTVIFSKKDWTAERARKWLAEHGMKSDKVDESENSLRFRQFDPGQCREGSYVSLTEDFPAGVTAVSCTLMEKSAEPEPPAKTETFKTFVEIAHFEEIEKGGEKKRLIYGIVYEPYTIDAQNDWADDQTIERAAHRWMIDSRRIKVMHRFNTDKILPVESYIAPCDFKLGKRDVKKGSWVLVTKVFDEKIWEGVTTRKLTGYSLGGRSTTREVAPPKS